jgi:hypothetical protein
MGLSQRQHAMLRAVAGQAVSGAAWTPASLGSQLKLWFDATQITATNGELLTTWPDKSGNAYDGTNAVANAAQYGTNIQNGNPAVRFTGTSRFLLGAVGARSLAAGLAHGTIYITMCDTNPSAGTAFHPIFSFSTAADASIIKVALDSKQNNSRIVGANARRFDTDLRVAANMTFTNNLSWHYVAGVWNYTNNTVQAFYDSTNSPAAALSGSGPSTNTASLECSIGYFFGGPAQYFNGYIGEIIMVTNALTSAEHTSITNYLRQKWATP